MVGSIPAPHDKSFQKITTFSETFLNCTGLTGSIPEGLFSNCPNVTNFDNTFSDCSGLTGSAPELWKRTNVTKYSECFERCTNLDNYSDIPDNWK